MYEILAYLYEHCHHRDLDRDREHVVRKLSAAGFDDSEIRSALSWIADAHRVPSLARGPLPDSRTSLRVFSEREITKLDHEARGFLLRIEQGGFVTADTRETILDRALATAGDSITLEQIKVVVLMVLWNRPSAANRLLTDDLLSPDTCRAFH